MLAFLCRAEYSHLGYLYHRKAVTRMITKRSSAQIPAVTRKA
jgi:hypothetical protein